MMIRIKGDDQEHLLIRVNDFRDRPAFASFGERKDQSPKNHGK
jgi:hypothetical protein